MLLTPKQSPQRYLKTDVLLNFRVSEKDLYLSDKNLYYFETDTDVVAEKYTSSPSSFCDGTETSFVGTEDAPSPCLCCPVLIPLTNCNTLLQRFCRVYQPLTH